jgi:hypothetical protein
MAATQEEAARPDASKTAESNPRSSKIDPAAPAGSKNSLGEESIRDGRPATDGSTVEAIDEETPATPASLPK